MGVAVDVHDCVRDGVPTAQHRLDLTEFDTQTTQLDLRVAAADELEFARRAPAHEVARAVHEGTGERVRDEPRGRHPGPVVVAAGQRLAGQVQLTQDTVGHGLQACVEHDGTGTADGSADGDGTARDQRIGHRDDDRGLGGAVAVEEPAARREPLDEFGRAHVAADHDGLEFRQPRRVDTTERGRCGEHVGDVVAQQECFEIGTGDDLGRRDHHRGSGTEGGEHLEDRRVEARRREP